MIFDAATRRQSKPLSTIQMQKLLLTIKVKDVQHYYIWSPGWTEWKELLPFLKSKQKYFVAAPIPKPPVGSEKKPPPLPVTNAVNSLFDQTKSQTKTGTLSQISKAPHLSDETTTKVFLDSLISEPSYTNVNPDTGSKPVDYGYYFNDFKADDIDINAAVQPSRQSKSPKKSKERRENSRHDFKIEVILISHNGKSFRSYSKNISYGGTLLEDEVPRDFLNSDFEMILINKFEDDRKRSRLHFDCQVIGDFRNPQRLTFKSPPPQMLERLREMLESYLKHQRNLPVKKSS